MLYFDLANGKLILNLKKTTAAASASNVVYRELVTDDKLKLANLENKGKNKMEIRVYNRLGEAQVYYLNPEKMLTYTTPVLPRSKNGDEYGAHGGADVIMRDMLFRGFDEDKLHQMADIRAGAMSLAVGFAANISMKEDRAVFVNELFDNVKVQGE